MVNIYREIVDLLNQGKAFALATVVESEGSSPGKAGAKMIVREDGSTIGTVGGGRVEFAVIKKGREVIRRKTPQLLAYGLKEANGLLCGGEVRIFVEPVVSDPALFIFGAGHIGQALSKIAPTAGFEVTVVDDREEFVKGGRFPGAKRLISGDYKRVISDLPLDSSSYIVVATRGHRTDEAVLGGCIERDYAYIGMVASKEKAGAILSRLRDRGVPDRLLRRVHTPIGLEIGSKTPGEIAVSILAEMISVRNSKDEAPISTG